MGKSQMEGLLSQIETILERHKVKQWTEIFRDLQENLSMANDERKKRLFLERVDHLFGGMDTFNDLYISPAGGDDILQSEVSAVNTRLRELRTRLYLLMEEEKAKDKPLE